MNPFLDLTEGYRQNNLQNARLITVGAKVGEGKTSAINTMILNFIEAGVNVIAFNEIGEYISKKLFLNIKLKRKTNKKLGNLVICDSYFENNLQSINNRISNYLEFMNGNCVIVIDYPIFSSQKNYFLNTNFKCENTRFVIFEKYNLKIKLDFLKKTKENIYSNKRQTSEALRNLAIQFNTHVIIASQHYKHPTEIGMNTSLMYASDIYITVKKNREQNTFLVTREKDRTGHIGEMAECILKENNLILATIKKC